jgi:Smg protein
MKEESVLDVLLYLFENYFYDDPETEVDRDGLQRSLLEAGFSPREINKAFHWLDELAEQRPENEIAAASERPVRVFAAQEIERLDTDAQGFLMFLDQQGILTATQRELVLDRVLALEDELVDLEDLKWVLLMVLFNQPGQEEAVAWMENLMFPEPEDMWH